MGVLIEKVLSKTSGHTLNLFARKGVMKEKLAPRSNNAYRSKWKTFNIPMTTFEVSSTSCVTPHMLKGLENRKVVEKFERTECMSQPMARALFHGF